MAYKMIVVTTEMVVAATFMDTACLSPMVHHEVHVSEQDRVAPTSHRSACRALYSARPFVSLLEALELPRLLDEAFSGRALD